MGVVIIHSHLHPGGVRTVIENQITALGSMKSKVLVGASDVAQISGANIEVIPELNYLNPDMTRQAYLDLYNILMQKIKQVISDDDIIHVHNINLGKNPVATLVLSDLAKNNQAYYNHCHDFAEDGRPDNLKFLKYIIEDCFGRNLAEVMYFNRPNCMYAVLNKRDFKFLTTQGIDIEHIQFLPNCVSHIGCTFKRSKQECLDLINVDSSKQTIVYPVRVIKRKNIGEFILLASIFTEYNWCVTLAPRNPEEIVEYKKWQLFCQENNIEIFFEIGKKLHFDEVMNIADRLITTSVQEGFGMAYLEPWLYDKSIFGRDITNITEDFKSCGLDLRDCYTSLNIYENDFANYASALQKKYILEILNNLGLSAQIRQLPELAPLLKDIDKNIVNKNKHIVQKCYSIDAYAKTLKENYAKITKSISSS